MAASLQPAAGMHPLFEQAPAGSSTVTRAAVQAQASRPAAGEAPFFEHATASHDTLTRSAVKAQTAAHRPSSGELDAMSRTLSVGNLPL